MRIVDRAFVQILFGLMLVLTAIGPSAVLSAEFKITYPESNSTVRGEVIEIEGTGATPGAVVEVSVLTNKWYLQDGIAEINDDGSWTYAPCYLSGKGQYNNHSIKVRLIKGGKPIATAKVRGVIRE